MNEEQTESEVNRKTKVIKIKANTHKTENRKTIEKRTNKTKNWFFAKINKICKPLSSQTNHEKKRRHKLPVSGVRAVITLLIL